MRTLEHDARGDGQEAGELTFGELRYGHGPRGPEHLVVEDPDAAFAPLLEDTPDLHDHGPSEQDAADHGPSVSAVSTAPIPRTESGELDLGTAIVARSAQGTTALNTVELLPVFDFSL